MEIFHDEIFGFGPGSLGPRPSRVPHRHGIFRDEILRVPGPLGLLIPMEIFHNGILGFVPRSLGPRAFGLFIAREIFHDVNLGFGPRSLGPRPFRAPENLGTCLRT